MATKVVEGVVYSMIHEVMSCGVIIQIGPGTKKRVRPGCLGSGLQPLIRSRVPGRIGPTPRQLLPDATLWLHTRVTVSNGLTTSTTKVYATTGFTRSYENFHILAPK